MPNGPSFVRDRSQRGEIHSQERSDIPFYQGEQPHGIKVRFQANNRGLIGPDEDYWPTTQEGIRIPHAAIVRSGGTGKASNAGIPAIDDTTYVPAWAVGDPR